MTSPEVRSWWAQQFTLDKYQGSTPNLYIWNDMVRGALAFGTQTCQRPGCWDLFQPPLAAC